MWTELEKGEAASSICPMPADQLTLPPRQGIDTFIPFMLQQRVSAGRTASRTPGRLSAGHKWTYGGLAQMEGFLVAKVTVSIGSVGPGLVETRVIT